MGSRAEQERSRSIRPETHRYDGGLRRRVCPVCASPDIHVLARRQRPDVFFTMKAPRKCKRCGAIFYPPSGVALSLAVVAMALTFGGAFVIGDVVPGIVAVVSPEWSVSRCFDLVLGLIATLYCAWIGYVAVVSARRVFVIR